MSAKPAKKTPAKPAKPAAKSVAVPQTAPAAAKRHGLGRGLGALIGGNASATPAKPEPLTEEKAVQHVAPTALPAPAVPAPVEQPFSAVLQIPLADISRSPWQPRHVFDEAALQELAESIKSHGIIQPLICRRLTASTFELIAGERRLRAAMEAGIKLAPVILVDAEDRKAAEMAIIENIQRQDLNAIEEAEGYRTLADRFNLTQQDVAERVGKARASVANALRLLDLPDEVKQLVADGRLSTGHAKVLLGLSDPTEQTLLARKCVTESLTVRLLERMIQRRAESQVPGRAPTPDMPSSHIQDLSDRLHRHFGTAIRLSPSVTHANGKHGKGCLEIDFYDNSDLDRILTLLGVTVN